MKVVVDIYGGDNAPKEIVKGCVQALKENRGFDLVLVGKANEIADLLKEQTVEMSRVEIVDAPDVITNDDVPTTAIRTKKESSLVVALDRVKNDEECIGMVSAGSTGAVLTGSFLKIGRIKGISRPALAPLLPTVDGGNVLLIDCGANVDCKPAMLAQFALMGNAYAKAILNKENPRVALMSNGTEDKKGNELTKEAFGLIKELPVNFVGNMEACDLLSGDFDVVVCDGFWGNVALKSCEGTAAMLMKLLKKEIMSGFFSKIAGAMLKKKFKNIQKVMDYNAGGGAPFIGVEKLVIKSHGSSKAKSICGSIMQVVNMHKAGLIEKIKKELYATNGEQPAITGN